MGVQRLESKRLMIVSVFLIILSAILLISFTIYSLKIAGNLLDIKAYAADLSQRHGQIRTELTEQKKLSNPFAALPKYINLEYHSSKLVQHLRNSVTNSTSVSVQYQLLPTGTIRLNESDTHNELNLKRETSIIKGKVSHSVAFLLLLEDLREKIQYMDIRGCKVYRLDGSKEVQKGQYLGFECMLSWYYLDDYV